jgi:ATP-dependent exoDNAse (exonuclease V) beta subunit
MVTDTLGREEPPRTDQVIIGTMHSSKGREYDAVVLFDYHSNLGSCNPEEIEEERRLFYVGLTRARESVLLTVDGSREGLHRFFKEAVEVPVEGERERLLRERERLREEEKALTIAIARLQEELDAILSGEALEKDQAAARELSDQVRTQEHAVSALAKRVEAKRTEHDRTGERITALEARLAASIIRKIGTTLTRRRRRLQIELTDAVCAREAIAMELENAATEFCSAEKTLGTLGQNLAATEERIALLRARPELVAADPKERLDSLRAKTYDLNVSRERLEGRLHQLDMLDGTKGHQGARPDDPSSLAAQP